MKIPSRALAGAGALILALQVHAADGQKIYSQGGANPAALACVTCHGANGEGMAAGGFPRLAGLSAAYMRKQLQDIRSGARSAPVMQPLAAALTDEEIAAVTEMLAALPAVDVPLVTRVEKADDLGAQLALRGAWARNILPVTGRAASAWVTRSRRWRGSPHNTLPASCRPGARGRARTIRTT